MRKSSIQITHKKILMLLCEDYSTDKIAEELECTPDYIRKKVCFLRKMWDVKTTYGLVAAYARKENSIK